MAAIMRLAAPVAASLAVNRVQAHGLSRVRSSGSAPFQRSEAASAKTNGFGVITFAS
jgi:hypothetical protein